MATRTKDISEQANGIATSFSLFDDYIPGSLEVYLNGVRQRRGVFFEEAGPQGFTTSEAPPPSDALLVQYEVVGAGDVIAFPTVVPSGISPGRP